MFYFIVNRTREPESTVGPQKLGQCDSSFCYPESSVAWPDIQKAEHCIQCAAPSVGTIGYLLPRGWALEDIQSIRGLNGLSHQPATMD